MKNQQRFAEMEYCIDRYFQTNLAPIMERIGQYLTNRQIDEYTHHQNSVAGFMSRMADASHMVPGLDTTAIQVQHTGEWNSKTTEDYVEMCRKDIAGDKTIQRDLELLSAEWRKTVVEEIGRERYEQLSKELGSDLAYAYLDYRVQQQMVQHLVDAETPRSATEYIMKKAASGSLIGLGAQMQQSPLSAEIADKAERAYSPTAAEKAAARGLSFGMDALSTGCIGSWVTVGKFAATEVVFDGIELLADRMQDGEKVQTVEECLSQVLFSSDRNLFPDLRKQGARVTPWDNAYVKGVNRHLEKKMAIADTKPLIVALAEERERQFASFAQNKSLPAADEQEQQMAFRKQHAIPLVIAPGKENDYLQALEESKARHSASVQVSETGNREATEQAAATSAPTPPQSSPQDMSEVRNPDHDNRQGWEHILGSLGLNGLGDIGHNLGYIISMLPDILVGMWTGKTKSLKMKDNLVPFASILAGMIVKNPILKMLLIGMGGANLLNKAGHEALAKAEGEHRQRASPQYMRYADQPLNPRISDVTLSGTTLIATIDRVPCTMRLTQDVVNACQSGALPLNTLANTILARSEQRQVVITDSYDRQQEQQRQQQVVIK